MDPAAASQSRTPVSTLDVIIRRAPGWPDGSDTLESLFTEHKGAVADVHLCATDYHPLPRAKLDVTLLQAGCGERMGGVCNRALAAGSSALVLLLDSTDVLMRHSLVRLQRALGDESVDASYGMVIDSSGDLTSALPLETHRLENRNYLATASLWRRSALESLAGWSQALVSETELTWDLWLRLGRSERQAHLIPRPVVRQRFLQIPLSGVDETATG